MDTYYTNCGVRTHAVKIASCDGKKITYYDTKKPK